MHQLVITADGSHTVFDTELGVTFHSNYGAIQESQHIYINAGLVPLLEAYDPLNIFEMGFGTGLNALLTLIASADSQCHMYYETVDAFPLSAEEYEKLNYCERLGRPDLHKTFLQFHECGWNTPVQITDRFTLYKRKEDVSNLAFTQKFQLVYFDAFDPVTQPALWTSEVFGNMHKAMAENGVLVTYSSKSSVRNALRTAGFTVNKLQGPPGKREFVKAART